MFATIRAQPPDPLFGINDACNKDTHPNKINLGVGAYRDENGKPWVLPVVRQVEQELLETNQFNKEYLPMSGLPKFCELTRKLMFGEESTSVDRTATFQTLSGTGALALSMTFLRRFHRSAEKRSSFMGTPFRSKTNAPAIYVSKPTWANHMNLAEGAGLECKEYRYYDPSTHGLDFDGMLHDINAAPARSIFLLHVCAHNPTGVDLNKDQWQQVRDAVRHKNHFVLFDCAYQGFATGNLVEDTYCVRLFDEAGLEFMVCQSFAKNFGLYGERAGALHIVCDSADTKSRVTSQLNKIVRQLYSNPPRHGAEIVATVLGNPEHFKAWTESLEQMSGRIIRMRKVLYDELVANGAPGTWNHIIDQIGMFSYTGLTRDQVLRITEVHHVYLTADGRISMAGLNDASCKYLAQAIKEVVTTVPASQQQSKA